ncbi:MAG: hypothetical protein AB4911_19010 [Oscillochloridaceae bacterium umkhey_bin13]
MLVLTSFVTWLTASPNARRTGGWDRIAANVAAAAQPADAIFFAPPWAQAPFVIRYHGPSLPLYGAESFASYYYEGGRPFTVNEFAYPALQRHLTTGGRAWIVWDRLYGVRPSGIDGFVIEEWEYGTTGLLLIAAP